MAAPVKEISKNPELAYDYTSKGNLVAVISNGSAILGFRKSWFVGIKTCNGGKISFIQTFC